MPSFDVIGDVHGCLPELLALLGRLGYGVDAELHLTPPLGRQLVWVGDLVDRGPDTPGVLRLVMNAVAAGQAVAVRGNHDERLGHALSGGPVRKPTANLEGSLKQLAAESPTFRRRAAAFLLSLPPRLTLDEGRLLVAHAGDRADLAGSERGEYNVHGHDFEERDAYGQIVREDWAALHTGPHLIVSGHTPVRHPQRRGLPGAGRAGTSIPAASTAAHSPLCVTRSANWSVCLPGGPTLPAACFRRSSPAAHARSSTRLTFLYACGAALSNSAQSTSITDNSSSKASIRRSPLSSSAVTTLRLEA